MENQNIVYVYKYLWQMKGQDGKTFVKVLSASMFEHNLMRESLLKNEEVIKASCVYLSEYNVDKLEMYESIKKEKKVDEAKNG